MNIQFSWIVVAFTCKYSNRIGVAVTSSCFRIVPKAPHAADQKGLAYEYSSRLYFCSMDTSGVSFLKDGCLATPKTHALSMSTSKHRLARWFHFCFLEVHLLFNHPPATILACNLITKFNVQVLGPSIWANYNNSEPELRGFGEGIPLLGCPRK